MNLAKNVFTIILLLACAVPFVSCEEEILHKGKTPLLSVGKEFLYREDVQRLYAASHGSADSAQFVDEFIARWAEEALFYHLAKRNVAATAEIDELVESYKRSLILNIYQESLVEQQLNKEIQPEAVQEFYTSNASMFEAKEPLVKGLFIRVPRNASKLSSLRSWYKTRSEENLEKLDKYSLTDEVIYDYFAESWRKLADLAEKTPLQAGELEQRLSKNRDIEFKDGDYIYLISLDSLVRKGEMEPLELVESEIRLLLSNTMKAEFIKDKKRSLYEEALGSGTIKRYGN